MRDEERVMSARCTVIFVLRLCRPVPVSSRMKRGTCECDFSRESYKYTRLSDEGLENAGVMRDIEGFPKSCARERASRFLYM